MTKSRVYTPPDLVDSVNPPDSVEGVINPDRNEGASIDIMDKGTILPDEVIPTTSQGGGSEEMERYGNTWANEAATALKGEPLTKCFSQAPQRPAAENDPILKEEYIIAKEGDVVVSAKEVVMSPRGVPIANCFANLPGADGGR